MYFCFQRKSSKNVVFEMFDCKFMCIYKYIFFLFLQYVCLVMKCKYIFCLFVETTEHNLLTSDFIESYWHLILRLDNITNKSQKTIQFSKCNICHLQYFMVTE